MLYSDAARLRCLESGLRFPPAVHAPGHDGCAEIHIACLVYSSAPSWHLAASMVAICATALPR
jgi:hypothetical protein